MSTNATGRLALLQETRLVDDEHRLIVGKRIERVLSNDVAQGIGIPPAAPENRMLALRARGLRLLRHDEVIDSAAPLGKG